MLTCSCHAIYIKQRHLGAGVSHYRRCDTQSDNVTGLCHRFGMCHGVCASDVTGWHVMRQMSQVWHVSWRLCVRCHGVRASDVMSRNVKTAAASVEGNTMSQFNQLTHVKCISCTRPAEHGLTFNMT